MRERRSWIYCATIQLGTPLRTLKRHGTIKTGSKPPAPTSGGIWMEALPGQNRLYGTMASQWGYIPADGGKVLQLLIAAKTAAAGNDRYEVRRARLQAVIDDPQWGGALVDRIGQGPLFNLLLR